MAQKDDKKRLGKKHRQASTRPKKGRAPKATPTTGAVDPRKRKVLSTAAAKKTAAKRISRRSPEFEARKPIAPDTTAKKRVARSTETRPADGIVGRQTPRSANVAGREHLRSDEDWRDVELLAAQMATTTEHTETRALPLIAICGRPNVGKSTLFNRLTGSRRSIVGDEPGITRDRIYGEIEWMNREARLVDTGGVIPDDEALIPSEIFRQAQVALDEADAIVMVVDGRTETGLARPRPRRGCCCAAASRSSSPSTRWTPTRCWPAPRTSAASASATCCPSRPSTAPASATCSTRSSQILPEPVDEVRSRRG